jgi:hypothetical protein
MKAVLLGLCLGPVFCQAEIPTLRFDDKVTWEQVFDSGFRPKHLEGLESHRCVCLNQSFWLQFRDREPKLKIENGRLAFSFYYDDFVSMIWHQGAEAITMEEGRRRAGEFRKLFDGFVVKEISMPRVIDASGLVDAGNDENNIKARVGEYLIWYGFDNSMRSDRPLIPHFYIGWGFPGQPDHRSKDPRDVVRPPAGYEWYSLDPKVDTPDPGSSPQVAPETVEPVSKPEEITAESKRSKPPQEEKQEQEQGPGIFGWFWRIGLIAGVVLAALLLKRRFSKGSA